MFTYNFSNELEKRIRKLSHKDAVLSRNFYKKVNEIIRRDSLTIQAYKNLKSPQNEFKRVHLTSQFVLIFKVDLHRRHISFVEIHHWDKAYD